MPATEVERWVAEHRAPVPAILSACRTAILQEVPGLVEWINGWKRLAIGSAPKMNAVIFVLDPREDRVNLEIESGAFLDDPAGLLEGTGKTARHLKLRAPEDLDRPEVRALIRAGARTRPSWVGRPARR